MKKLITSSSALWSGIIALVMMMASQSAWAEYVKLTALEGVDAFSGGGESHKSLVDANPGSKWGCWFDPSLSDEDSWPTNTENSSNKCYIIVKAEKAVVPEYYFLVTGNDTGSNPGRNWATWKIYGGNFASDDLAVRGDEGWTLIDSKEDEPLPAANTKEITLDFSVSTTTAYQYFWIEIEKTVENADVYQQMGEWGLGSYGDFQKYLKDIADAGTSIDEPVRLNVLEGTKMTGGENLPLLFDGDVTTKWGNGLTNRQEGETTNGAYFIVKASRSMLPTYYALTTANDTQQYSGRNWKQWQIYGMNAASDEEVTRSSEKWVALDKKYNVGTDQLPAANYTQAFFTLSEANDTEYRYFKVELDQIVSSGDYMQMAEFALGDQYTLALDIATLVASAEENFDPETFAEKAQLDKMEEIIANVKACTDPAQLGSLRTSIDSQIEAINQSAANYAELLTARNQAVLAINGGNLTDEAIAYLTNWISEEETITPSDDYPYGNLAYIKANRQLTGSQAVTEAKRINAYIIMNAKEMDDAIYATYEAISGSGGFGGEDHSMLYDGDRESTKWCTNTLPAWTVFKSDTPIQPTYYGLVTGGDTHSYPGRNWKTWKIWAANFDSDEEATRNSDKWVLIDNKVNIGTDILKTDNKFESYIYLSEGCAEKYQYFKIEVTQAGSGDLIQMNEFTFYNTANFMEYRQDFLTEFEDYNPDDYLPAYKGYIDEYKEKYQELVSTVNAPDLMKIKNELGDLQNQIAESNELYMAYEDVYSELEVLDIDAENLGAWHEGYTTENIAPCSKYMRGTYAYIMENLSLDNDGIKTETEYLQRIVTAYEEGLYILLDGHTVGEWGDGFYGNLIDGIALNTTEIDEETGEEKEVKATKWGGMADANGNTYIIFRTFDPVNPFFYTLTTGNDTGTHQDRNWGTWYIYGANFEGDGDATKDAEGWVLVDAKENIGKDRLHPVNAEPSYFGFSTETTEKYTYYKVVVTKAFNGTAIQMNELHFGTAEEFAEIKAQYKEAAEEFDTFDVLAQQSLLDEYDEVIPDIDDCENMEALFRVNYQIETLRDAITSSIASYAKFQQAVEDNKAYLKANKLADSEAKTIFENYLNKDVINPTLYPNGTAVGILFEHEVGDSILAVEMDFMESLKAAAVAAGYGPGMEISSLIVNRTFKKAGEMLKDEKGNNIGREAEGWDGYIYRTASAGEDIYAAEFCNENKIFDISQTLTDLKNGFYKVTLNAGYRANGDDKMLSYNYAAMAYANDASTYVPVIREYPAEDKETAWTGTYADKQIYSADSTETYGYGIWGCEGAANAFAQGRFAITLVAQVTDGTLTIGVKNEGTMGNEWTAVGNFGLVYLGEEEATAAAALQEVAECNAERINVLTELYVADVEDEENYPAAPGFGAAQKEALAALSGVATFEAEKAIGEIMESIYATKKAYVDLLQATTKVYNKWYEYAGVTDAEDAIFDIRYENMAEGKYDDAEAAKAAKAELYAAFPSYLELTASSKVAADQEGFTFTFETEGGRAYIDMKNIYEALAEDETILAFDYTAEQDLENGRILYNTPSLMTDPAEQLSTIPATAEWTTAYVNVANGVSALQLGSATDHGIRWYFNYNAGAEQILKLGARNFRFITEAQMNAEGGKPLNGTKGDLNGDSKVDIADAVTVLNIMAAGEYNKAADINNDGKVDIADFVSVLNIMAAQ